MWQKGGQSDKYHETYHEFEWMNTMAFCDSAVSTGFRNIDSMLGGFKRGQTYLLGSRPGMGKTTFALHVVNYLLLHEKGTVAYFASTERSDKIVRQLVMNTGRFNDEEMKLLEASKSEDRRFCEAKRKVAEANVFIDDTTGISVDKILETCSSLKKPIDLIVVDDLQLVVQMNPVTGQHYSESDICRMLSDVAHEFHCPVLILFQLGRECELRADHHPTMKDLTDSMIDKAVDNVFFLFRDDYYNDDSAYLNIVEFYIAEEEYVSMKDSAILAWIPEKRAFCSVV